MPPRNSWSYPTTNSSVYSIRVPGANGSPPLTRGPAAMGIPFDAKLRRCAASGWKVTVLVVVLIVAWQFGSVEQSVLEAGAKYGFSKSSSELGERSAASRGKTKAYRPKLA